MLFYVLTAEVIPQSSFKEQEGYNKINISFQKMLGFTTVNVLEVSDISASKVLVCTLQLSQTGKKT